MLHRTNRGLVTRPEATFITPPLLPQLFGWICTSPRGLTLTTLALSFCCRVAYPLSPFF